MANFIRLPPDIDPFSFIPGEDKVAELAIHRDDFNREADCRPYFDRPCLNVETTPAGCRIVPCDRLRTATGNLVVVEVV